MIFGYTKVNIFLCSLEKPGPLGRDSLLWHSDYVDHVDEDTLCKSFERFMQKISFKIIRAVQLALSGQPLA